MLALAIPNFAHAACKSAL